MVLTKSNSLIKIAEKTNTSFWRGVSLRTAPAFHGQLPIRDDGHPIGAFGTTIAKPYVQDVGVTAQKSSKHMKKPE
jgi:hypothetical protein